MFLLQGLGFGGLEKMACDLAISLKKNKIDVEVCCFDELGEFYKQLKDNNIPVFFLPRRPGVDLSYFVKFARLIKKRKVNIVHAHNSTAWFYSVFACLISKVPLIYTEHDRSFPTPLHLKLLHYFFGKCSKVIAVSKAVKEDLERFEKIKDIEVIVNGIDASLFCPATYKEKLFYKKELGFGYDDIVMINVGRMDKLKNQAIILDVLKEIKEVKLILVGDGENRRAVEEKAKSLGLEDRVLFLGKRTDVNRLLRGADIFIFPSLTEGLPLAVIEAMASGMPIIASRVGGIPELVQPEVNGFLINPNSFSDIKRAVEKLVFDRDLRIQMGQNSRILFEKEFSLEQMTNKYKEVYHKALL